VINFALQLLHFEGETMPFRLTPPTQLTLLISVVLAILAVVLRLTHSEIPILGAHTFALLGIEFLFLFAGTVIVGV
jgi:hypothetical protein